MQKKKILTAQTLTIKIGGNMEEDEARIFNDPEYAKKPSNTLYLDNYEQLAKLLSPKKLALLQVLITHADTPKTIGQIARQTKRKQAAISRDIHQLKRGGLLELKKQKHEVYAHAPFHTITIQIPNTA